MDFPGSESYVYDEIGNRYPFFFLIVLLLILIPGTIGISRWSHQHPLAVYKGESPCSACLAKAAKFKRRRKAYFMSIAFLLKCILLLLGWIAACVLFTTIITNRTNITIWDPFKILDVAPFSSLDHVKRQFKTLSRKLHPDKQRNVSKEKAEEMFVDLTKAYKALTNPDMRDNYLACGNPDHCTDKVILGIALPKAFKSQTPWSYAFVLLYGWGLVVIVPSFMGHWWTQRRKTDNGLSQETANLFFKFATEKKGASFSDLIWLFCETEEICQEVEAVWSRLYGKTFLNCLWTESEVAEYLIKTHLKRELLGHPILEDLQDRILLHLPALAEHLFDFFTETKSPEAIMNTIYLLQQIRQISLPGIHPRSRECSEDSTPFIQLRHISFRGHQENGLVVANSTVSFSCEVEIYDPDQTFRASNATNSSAHTPFFPTYHKARWYIFLTVKDSDSTIFPIKIANISYKPPKRIKFQFATPESPCKINFKVHAISDSYVGLDWEGEAIMQVGRRKLRPRPKRRVCWDEEDEDCFGCSSDVIMESMQRPGIKTITQGGLEGLILKFLKQKTMKERLRDEVAEIAGEIEKESKVTAKEGEKKGEHTDKGEEKGSTPSITDNSDQTKEPNSIPQSQQLHGLMNVEDGDGDLKPAIKAYAKQCAFIWWQEIFARKRVLMSSLEDLLYDTLGESESLWYDNHFCALATWYLPQKSTRELVDHNVDIALSSTDKMRDEDVKELKEESADQSKSKQEEDIEDSKETSSSESMTSCY